MNIRCIAFLLTSATLLPAQSRGPLLLVLNKEEATLAIVDPESRKVLGRVGTGEQPHEVVASEDGKLAFVSNYGTGPRPGKTISVIDVTAMKELRRVDLGSLSRPHGIAIWDGKVLFTSEANKLIGRYDPSSDRIDWLLGTGQNSTHMVQASRDGNTIFTANIGSNTITIISRVAGPAGWDETVVPVGKGPEGFDLSPDGKQLWAANSQGGTVSVVDLATKKLVDTFEVGTKRSNRLKFTPDGKLVFVSDLAGGELVVVDAATHKEVKRLPLGKGPEGILMATDGSAVYSAVSGENYVAVIDPKTLAVKAKISTGTGPDGMAWAGR